MVRICPFISINQPANQTCPAEGCTLWVKTERGGNCAVTVIAEELRESSASTDMIADSLAEIAKGIDMVVGAMKGLM